MYKEYDLYLEGLLQSFYPEALENLLYEWALYEKFDGDAEDFEDEDYQKIIQENSEDLTEYKKSLFFPTYEKRCKLNYPLILPHPLGELTHQCFTKQFYFMKDDKKLYVAVGCSCGSGTRYTHGLYGHFFTLLQKEGKPITSFVTKINKKCQFKVIKQAPHLILYKHDLIGNYSVGDKRKEEIFKGIDLYFPPISKL